MGNFYMVFELASGNLLTMIKESENNFMECDISRIVGKILKGIYVLHDNNVVHGDIKLENILVFNKGKEEEEVDVQLKIGDLGFSYYHDDKKLLSHFSGSPLYAAPEITLSLPYDGRKSDIWSLGVVVYYLTYLKFPFDVEGQENLSLLFNKIQNESIKFNKTFLEVSEDCKDLLTQLLNKNPTERPDIHQIIKHTWCENILIL